MKAQDFFWGAAAIASAEHIVNTPDASPALHSLTIKVFSGAFVGSLHLSIKDTYYLPLLPI